MLPVKKRNFDNRHQTDDSKRSTDVKKDVPVNITLPANAACYIIDITIPVIRYTIEPGNMLQYTSN